MIDILRNPKTVCNLISSKNIFVNVFKAAYTYYFSLTAWEMGKCFLGKKILCKLKTEI